MLELELVPTPDLIKELFNRTTFVGVLVYSDDEIRASGQVIRSLKVESSADSEGTQRLLEMALEAVKQTE